MKISRNTPSLLIAGEIPWLIAIALLLFTLMFVGIGMAALLSGIWAGAVFVVFGGGLGLGAMAVFVERLQVILDRNALTLTLRRRTLLNYNETIVPLRDVVRAGAQTSQSGCVSDTNHPRQTVSRLAFEVHDGDAGTVIIPLTQVMSNSPGTAIVARAANEWLQALHGGYNPADG